MNKEEVIKSITQRIKDEYRKHKDLDWEEIAARKIYSTHFEQPETEVIDFRVAGAMVSELAQDTANNIKYTDEELKEKFRYKSNDNYFARKFYKNLSSLLLNIYLNRLHEVGENNKEYITNARKLVKELIDELNEVKPFLGEF